jgi:hypothetical protein
MRNRKYRRHGLGISTIALMVLCITVMVLPMNIAALGYFRCVYIEGTYVPYEGTYPLSYGDFVNGTFDCPPPPNSTPTFSWRLDQGFWNPINNVIHLGGGVYNFNFTMDEWPGVSGTLWIQATEGYNETEWHCYYYI